MVEWKVPGASPDSAELELYDYETDPLETKNLAAENPAVVEKLRAILATHPEAKPQLKVITPEQASKIKADKEKRVNAFRKRDTNGDGRLSLEEFLIKQPDPEGAPKRFPIFDKDGDGLLTEAEYVSGGK